MKSGLRPTRTDHRDYDFIKSFGATEPPSFPDEYSTDAGLWMPNQNVENDLFAPPVPPLPYGCTDYAQADLCVDEDGVLRNPMDMENITHANALQGIDMRTAVKAALKAYGRTAFFNIRWTGPLDAFDAVRISMLSTANEKRAVSIGSPFYPEFWNCDAQGRLPIPSDFSVKRASWHNWAVKGWKTIDGAPYLICKMWLDKSVGDGGFLYMSRELFNAIMNISGSVAYTLSKTAPGQILPIDVSFIQFIVSYMRNLLAGFTGNS